MERHAAALSILLEEALEAAGGAVSDDLAARSRDALASARRDSALDSILDADSSEAGERLRRLMFPSEDLRDLRAGARPLSRRTLRDLFDRVDEHPEDAEWHATIGRGWEILLPGASIQAILIWQGSSCVIFRVMRDGAAALEIINRNVAASRSWDALAAGSVPV